MMKTEVNGGSFAIFCPDTETVLNARDVFNHTVKKVNPASEDVDGKTRKHVPWGSNDDEPFQLLSKGEKDTVITGVQRFKTEMQYGGGLAYGKIEIDAEGSDAGLEKFKYLRDPSIDSWLRKTKAFKTVFDTFFDLNYFANAFPQITLSKDGSSIARITTQYSRAKTVRLLPINKEGDFTKAVLNSDFGNQYYKQENDQEIDVLPEWGAVEFMREQAKKGKRNFLYRLSLTDTGRQHYSRPDWKAAIDSGWVQISETIALFKKYLMENQASIKYHIEVDEAFWPSHFGKDNWEAMDHEKKKEAMKNWVQGFSDFMKGAKGAGNIFLSPMVFLDTLKEHRHLFKIHELKGTFSKDGTYIEDSREATEHKMIAMGMHPDIIGSAPGTKLGSGSGSGNRIAFNQRLSMTKFIQDLALSPLYLVSEYNGWGEDIEWRMRESLITTLDTGAAATAPKAQA